MESNIEISPFGNNLIFKSGYNKEFILSTLKEKQLGGIKINTRWERLNDLDFLSEYDFLESLDIVGMGDFDFSFLFSLKNLKRLSISLVGNNPIDLAHQAKLESLTIQWRKGKILGLTECNSLRLLCLVDYKEEDFKPISSLLNLEDLKIKTASIKNCTGIEKLTKLNSLLFGNCKKLESLNGIESLNKLTSLSFHQCPLANNYDLVGLLHALENLEIIDCKGVSSIKFIEKLPSLRKLSLLGNTDVLDGDMEPARKVNEVFYKHRKHYNTTIDNKENDELVKANLKKIKGLFK